MVNNNNIIFKDTSKKIDDGDNQTLK